MKPIALLVLALGAVIMAVLVFAVVGQTFGALRTPSYAERAADAAHAERIVQQAELDAAWAPHERAASAVLLFGALAGALAYVGALASLHIRRTASERLPNAAGLLPVLSSDQAAAVRALAAWHGARQLEAQRQMVPTHYAPHIITHRHDTPAQLEAPAALALVAPTPTFAELLDSGRVGQGNPMLLGFCAETGAPVEGSWLDLYSCGLGGLSGSGKSWTACYLAAQAALFGTRIVLLDPHASNAESLAARLAPLAGRFVCAPAESPKEMLAAVALVSEELRRRKGGGRDSPMLFIADEYSALQRGELATPLAELVEALGQEGRKLGLFALVAGQVWTASRAGGSCVRDSLASAYVHRCRPAQARYLTGMTAADLPRDLLELPSGTAYLLDTSGDFRRVTIPRMASGDMGRVAGLLTDDAPAMPRLSARFQPGISQDAAPDYSASGSGAAPSAEAARVVALFLGGMDAGAIVTALTGMRSKGGTPYLAKLAEVQAVIRRAMQA